MSGHITQRYILKLHTERLARAKWNLGITLDEARRNDEVISIGDSQMLRWIDELTGKDNPKERISEIRREIRRVRKLPSSPANVRQLKKMYGELDSVQFVPDYIHLVIDKNKQFLRACKGFVINGVRFVRLVGTTGGVKNSTIVFVNETLSERLRARIDNGRDQGIPWIPAKLEAYRALTCSGSTPVSDPRGILLVNDCETLFKEDVITLNNEGGEEPEMKFVKDFPIKLDESDGYGLMLPSLAKRWSEELGLDYTMSGANTRYAFEKGMVFTFDFIEFAEKVAHTYEVKDAWGAVRDIRECELVLTTSQLKLWKCYKSMEEYLGRCKENHYSFGIPKTCPKKLEDKRGTNYQFIQSYRLDDQQLNELIQPTIDEIRDVLSGDYRKAILFLRGTGLTEEDVDVSSDFGVASALMVEPKVFNDSFIRKNIYHMIKTRIDEAKIGVLNVHGNYSIVCGDPFVLCQSMFSLPVTGLLKKGEIYSKYWTDCGATELACFRAPMSTHENIVKVRPVASEEMQHWYQYMTTCTLFNAWDSACARLNGMDKDGDLVMLTDNKVLVENIRNEPTIFCGQNSGEKKIVSEEDLIQSNIAGFGDDIGRITNYVTSMYDVQAGFEVGSEEYNVLAYRIRCGQQFQQDAIDKIKGIQCKPMPREWYDYHACRLPEDPTDEDMKAHELNRRILADKKPYFMRHIYPRLNREYTSFIRNTEIKCLRHFGMSVGTLQQIPEDALTEEQKEFLRFYRMKMPVGMGVCVMNRICERFEREFDGVKSLKLDEVQFDPEVLKSGVEYSSGHYYKISKLRDEYMESLKELTSRASRERIKSKELSEAKETIRAEFLRKASLVCSNERQLCEILIDLCYKRENTKSFVWSIGIAQILENLLEKKERMFSYPSLDQTGDIIYSEQKFSMKQKRSDPVVRDHFEREGMGEADTEGACY